MKIVLFYICDNNDRDAYYISMVPIHLLTLAAYLEKKRYDVSLVNLSNVEKNKMVKTVLNEKPSVIATMIFTHNRFETYKFLSKIKKQSPSVLNIIMGPFPTFISAEIFDRWSCIDYVIRDEAETVFDKFLKSLKSGHKPEEKIINGNRSENLKKIPFPSSFSGKTIGVDKNEQYKFIFSSRGMHTPNKYFNSPEYRESSICYRTPDDMVKEVEYIYRKYGIIYFLIRDENFTLSKNKVIEFCRKLRRKNIYPVWNCRSRPEVIDEELIQEMKMAGLERILLNVKTGSEKLLDQFDGHMQIEDVIRASKIIRRTGVYLTEYYTVGMPGESLTDFNKSKSLIRKTLPGNVVIRKAAYFPGSFVYESDKFNGIVNEDIWFKNKTPLPGISDDMGELQKRSDDLKYTADLIREKAWYRSRNFRNHKKINLRKCWLTDILEGDYYVDFGSYNDAEKSFRKVISAFPDNPWGYLRQGTVKFQIGDFESAEDYFQKVTEIVPNYFGGWIKVTESRIATGKKNAAKKSFKKAYELNKFDHRVINIKTIL